MRTPNLPSWTKGLLDSTILFTCDILEFFKYKNTRRTASSVAVGLIREGLIIKPSILKDKFKLRGPKCNTKYYWLLGDIRKLRLLMLEKGA